MKTYLNNIIQNELKLKTEVTDFTQLFGDASYRTYSRIQLGNGETLIIMQMPAGKQSASEEISNFSGELTNLPFINIAKYLQDHDIAVPKILYYDEKKARLFLEDLGEDQFFDQVHNKDEATITTWYKRAIDLLVKMQTTCEADDYCYVFKRNFDATLLNWEFDHFLEYGLSARGIELSDEEKNLFQKQTRKITEKILQLSTSFTHRDFQSRNIMIKNDQLYLIDFQDALVGPKTYDLVALTRDSYVQLNNEQLDVLINYYADKVGRNAEDEKQEHALITVQRKLKDAGRFVYIDQVKGNSSYLNFIPASLNNVRWALEQVPEFSELFELLKTKLPEWK